MIKRALTVSGLLLFSWGAHAEVDIFLTIPGIPGESRHEVFEDSIDVLAFDWGLGSDEMSTKTKGQPGCIRNMEVTKFIDSATGPLVVKSVMGETIPEATLSVRSVGGASPLVILELVMTDIQVVALNTNVSGGDDRPTEVAVLNFEFLEGTYTPQESDGRPGTPVEFDILGSTCK